MIEAPKALTPAARRALALLLSKEWVSGNELLQVAGARYGARIDELKAHGWAWEKKWIKGRSVPLYRLFRAEPEQLRIAL